MTCEKRVNTGFGLLLRSFPLLETGVMSTPPLLIPPVPPPPPPPPLSEQCIAGNSGTHHGGFVRNADNMKEEVSYLVQPLCARAGGQGQTIFTLVHDVNPVIQHGPICGLVALSIASQLVNSRVVPPDHLLTCAKERGYSKQGEMFSAQNLLELAKSELYCTGKLLNASCISVRELLTFITESKAIVVPYDADKDHSPCLARGHKAHWCTLVGFAIIGNSFSTTDSTHTSLTPASAYRLLNNENRENDIYLFARQGKSRHLGLWSYTSLIKSNANLMEVGPERGYSDYVIPPEGIYKSLCSWLVVLYKS